MSTANNNNNQRKNPFKRDKLQEKILTSVNLYLRSQLRDPRLQMVSLSRVELSPDYSQAFLYWDTHDSSLKEKAEEAFSSVRGKVRTYLAGILESRVVPEIFFHYDAQFEAERHIEDLLKK